MDQFTEVSMGGRYICQSCEYAGKTPLQEVWKLYILG